MKQEPEDPVPLSCTSTNITLIGEPFAKLRLFAPDESGMLCSNCFQPFESSWACIEHIAEYGSISELNTSDALFLAGICMHSFGVESGGIGISIGQTKSCGKDLGISIEKRIDGKKAPVSTE